MDTRIIVCGIVVKGDKVLLGKKARGRHPYPDVWHTLDGGVDDFQKANLIIEKKMYDDPYLHSELKRELMEEGGIAVKNIHCICPKFRKKPRESIAKNKQGKDTHYIFLEYLCGFDGGEVRPASEIIELRWVNYPPINGVGFPSRG